LAEGGLRKLAAVIVEAEERARRRSAYGYLQGPCPAGPAVGLYGVSVGTMPCVARGRHTGAAVYSRALPLRLSLYRRHRPGVSFA
jgi:hypothetical protein